MPFVNRPVHGHQTIYVATQETETGTCGKFNFKEGVMANHARQKIKKPFCGFHGILYGKSI